MVNNISIAEQIFRSVLFKAIYFGKNGCNRSLCSTIWHRNVLPIVHNNDLREDYDAYLRTWTMKYANKKEISLTNRDFKVNS